MQDNILSDFHKNSEFLLYVNPIIRDYTKLICISLYVSVFLVVNPPKLQNLPP
ncbi:hypothetical protein Anacy_1644 [Anabaena cylindrica PCC 7122]|uniref:Uncharacterized protein n=1 Tax=Anabaena cylindrica (strain ATCC 27899 / PCC 7122) TaxID=272123 RepID=K9ZFL6_ANACC|nr:hypothetical protein Anacy_1644 [Anabaena cylindrica PCC 7122]BAY05885.1 hypothetical protein NIES19_51620 [Anabaena cylindrica PCC 7122]